MWSSKRVARTLLCLTLTACAVRLTNPDEELPNGGVSGPVVACGGQADLGSVDAPAALPRFLGRVDPVANPMLLTWSGTSVVARFTGTEIAIRLKFVPVEPQAEADKSRPDDPIKFAVIVDGGPPFEINVEPRRAGGFGEYLLATGLPEGPHDVFIERNVESLVGATEYWGFRLAGAGGGKFLPPPIKNRRIQIIGDSITCGYGVLGANVSCPFTRATQNHFMTYGAITARALGAELTTVAYSGKGIIRNASDRDPTTFPMIFERTNPEIPESTFDFTRDPAPGVVVINLGTNDFNEGVPDLQKFTDAYKAFVLRVRAAYPQAHIFCALSPMLSDVNPGSQRSNARLALDAAVNQIALGGDARVYSMEFLDQGVKHGLGCNYHPNLITHKIMADQLIGAIRTKLCW